ncbi:GAF domain-containing protein [Poritiphilus flavus]|nr:GAF domain-containing protein [Poritiphilus flavus]
MPLKHLISFDKLLRSYDEMAKSKDALLASKAKHVLEVQAPYPELREGFSDVSLLDKHKDVISTILQDSFAEVLSENEIKAASLPYYDIVFNSSRRFQKIIKNAGPDFKPFIRNRDEGIDYIMACTVILNFYYGYKLDFSRPYFYDIPDANGVMHHYRILYNADFMELFPTDKAKELTQDDVDELLENPDDLKLWKEKIPPESFVSKGFVISNMFDVTAEQAISEIKTELIANDKRGSDDFMQDLQETFRSFFRLKDLRVGFVTYNSKSDQFERVYGKGMESFILNDKDTIHCDAALCEGSYRKILKDNDYFAISDVDKYFEISGGSEPYKGLHAQGIKSAIFAPIAAEDELLGVLEVVSTKKGQLNGVNATKLDDVMPYIVSAVIRSKIEEENLIDAIIQHECTSVHSSVYWKFQEEAKRFIVDDLEGRQASFREIVFKDVYPLYGQVDIKDSSQARNTAIQRDLMIQLSSIKDVLDLAFVKEKLPIYEELIFRADNYIESIKETLYSNSEQTIFDFVQTEVNPVLDHLKKLHPDLEKAVKEYEDTIDSTTQSYYDHRRNYDESVMEINRALVGVIDQKQVEAQEMYPHYFERFKTDGVEHNMYIGDSISGEREYDPLYLSNLRLWQLQVMCEMENKYYNLKPQLPVQLDVASLALVYSTSLSIRFRMDEKQFDVDGTYNARYEIIKKRIDKSYIKGTDERLTQKGKLSIVYSQKKDELEYLRYISFLKSKGYFTNNVEIVELEGLQGVSGLKAIRAEILYKKGKESEKTYTYQDLMEELKV